MRTIGRRALCSSVMKTFCKLDWACNDSFMMTSLEILSGFAVTQIKIRKPVNNCYRKISYKNIKK